MDNTSPLTEDTAILLTEQYHRYSQHEAHNSSPIYEQLSTCIADDNAVKSLILQLPQRCWQPNLLFGAYRFAGHKNYHYPDFRKNLLTDWPAISEIMLTHRTQTNEVARCGTLLPLLGLLPEPIALLEIGTSATACLHLDKYHYTYEITPAIEHSIGPCTTAKQIITLGNDSSVEIHCAATSNTPIPQNIPTINHRAGLDISPLDPTDPATRYWLECLIWPEHHTRLERLQQALRIAAAQPISVIKSDAVIGIDDLLATVPEDHRGNQTIVIFHSAVAGYLSSEQRSQFYDKMLSKVHRYPQQSMNLEDNTQLAHIHWISFEPFGVFPKIDAQISPVIQETLQFTPQPFIVSLDGMPQALVGPHGQYIQWIADKIA